MLKRGFDVTWVAAVSLSSFLSDVVLRRGRIQAVQNKCASEGIKFCYIVIPLPINGPLSFLLRRPVLGWAANRLATVLKPKEDQKTIFHARSYFSAHLACEIKAKSKRNSVWRVSFDMRSLLPEEFALAQGILGKVSFGFAKQWEHELLRKSDVSFLPLNFARHRIQKESGNVVDYVPIQGFDRDPTWAVDFEQRWTNKHIGYAGSIGVWHDPVLLREILQSIPGTNPMLATPPHPELKGMKSKTYQQHEMASYYDGLLALIIPGRLELENYFIAFQMRCNLFSTKAAEALSRGTPLIVSSQLSELADFVRQNQCGGIYDPTKHQFIYPTGNWLTNKAEWQRITEGAIRIGEMLTRNYAMELYLSKWNLLFDIPKARQDLKHQSLT
jgi:hypothetical protein